MDGLNQDVGALWQRHPISPIHLPNQSAQDYNHYWHLAPSIRIEIQSSKVIIFLRMYRNMRHVEVYFAAKISTYDLSG